MRGHEDGTGTTVRTGPGGEPGEPGEPGELEEPGEREEPGEPPAGAQGTGGTPEPPDAGMATAEYAMATLAACGFAGLLIAVLRSDEVRAMLLGVVRQALTLG
ncbi:DUF4244 domain-containing protein [Kineococcus sp. LSe6-4]|uniref:DUF4244 domain-containing protein n=1 Tax=Kineococcus halophytocola TaxID=3234027 RepID=A0ABV4H487_9ACTN